MDIKELQKELIKLMEKSNNLGNIKSKIFDNLNNFSQAKLIELINIFTSAEKRMERINKGEYNEVLTEIEQEKEQKIKNQKMNFKKTEMNIRQQEEMVINNLLKQVDNAIKN